MDVFAELVWVNVVEYKLPWPSSFNVTVSVVNVKLSSFICSPKYGWAIEMSEPDEWNLFLCWGPRPT